MIISPLERQKLLNDTEKTLQDSDLEFEKKQLSYLIIYFRCFRGLLIGGQNDVGI